MAAMGCNQSTARKLLSIRSALSVIMLGASFFLSTGVNKSYAGIIETVNENMSFGSDSCNKIDKVTTFVNNTAHPVRSGQYSFKHWVDRCGKRAELSMKGTSIGSTYWYGWSFYLPTDWNDSDAGWDIISQFPTYPTNRNFNGDGCGAVGSYMLRSGDHIEMRLQHPGSKDIECSYFSLGKVSQLRGQWVDVVMQVKWTGNSDGFMKMWRKAGSGQYEQVANYSGATYWNDEGGGPYFKMGLYKGNTNYKGPAPRTIYTDEYRLGDGNSNFQEVAPR